MPSVRPKWHVWCAAALLLSNASLHAQGALGEIRVHIKDSSGASMAASGKLTGANNFSRLFTTGPQGSIAFQKLPFGHYRLEVSTPGFSPLTVPFDVRSETPIVRSLTMAVGTVTSNVDVIATTPLAGLDLPVEVIPSPVQTATGRDLAQDGALDLSDFMNRRLNGVHVNEMQGNPFQPDVNYRGFTASPLLGTPQGLSVYLDGVRQNQPFGDVVSWDLIPRNAISEITLVPGSNPVFGLNTLGGALSIQTKTGVTNPGLTGQLTYGSSGRKALQAEWGGSRQNGLDWFLSANAFHESGWRYDSPSDVRQGFARLGWRTVRTDLGVTLNYAYNTLTGNGLQDYRLLQNKYSGVYTVPDTIANRAPAVNFRVQHSFGDTLTVSGNAWYRNIRTGGINGNANTNSFDQQVYQPSAADVATLRAAGYSGYPVSGANASNTPFPSWRCIAQALQLSDPAARCDAATIYSTARQSDFGFSGQMTWLKRHNQLTAGASAGRGAITFTQNTQFGYLNPDRSITGVPAWQDGSTSDNGVPVDSRVDLHGTVPNWSLYGTDTLSIGKSWDLTVSGRYNRSAIHNRDAITPGGGPGSLDADDVFSRFNGSAGFTYNPTPQVNFYASYGQSSRAPTSIELGCADPNNPCSLPNALASDPPLHQVVTGTWEAGLRGKPERHFHWSAGWFRADNQNDIQFVAAEQTGAGYFKNFARTRRQGFQASSGVQLRRLSAGLDYTLLDATYQSVETVNGSGNSTNDTALAGTPGLDGVITAHPGDQIPLTPRHTGKLYADVHATAKLTVNLGMVAASSSYARGNENNLYRPDGKYYLGSGIAPGYAVFHGGAHYELNRRMKFVVEADNLFDRRYYTAAQLATTGLTSQGTFLARPFPAYSSGPQAGNYPLQHSTFYAPGAPRRIWVELRLKL